MGLMGICSPWLPRHPEPRKDPKAGRAATIPHGAREKRALEGLEPTMKSFSGSGTSHSCHNSLVSRGHGTFPPAKSLMVQSDHTSRRQKAGNVG